MADPLRVYVAARLPGERDDLIARLERGSWILVSDAARADVVLATTDEWTRQRSRAESPPRQAAAPVEALTPREREVLALVADGLHNREIAARLGVTEHTVKFHLGTVFGKLGATTRTEAVQKGVRLGVIDI